MIEKDLEKQIEEMPKAILHLHLDGSLRPETVYKWLKEQGQDVTLEQVKRDLMVDKDCRDLNEYLQKFDLPLQVLQTEDHIEQATYELFEDLSKQNVIYAEVRFAPSLHTQKGLEYDQIVEAAIRGMNKAKEEFGIDGNLILCCMRGNDNKENNLKTVRVAEKYLNKGVCALDLAGAEDKYPLIDYIDLFDIIKEKNIPFTIHAGENGSHKEIDLAIKIGTKRIGHGIHAYENEDTIKLLKEKNILLEICPTSNVQTNSVDNYENHPIYNFYESGLNVCINTDNKTVSNISLTDEYIKLHNIFNFNTHDFKIMNVNAIKSSFLTDKEKEKLINKITYK